MNQFTKVLEEKARREEAERLKRRLASKKVEDANAKLDACTYRIRDGYVSTPFFGRRYHLVCTHPDCLSLGERVECLRYECPILFPKEKP
jgi:hypothetical protein